MARPRFHIAASALVGLLLYRRTRRLLPVVAALAGGFLIDGDHLADRFLHQRFPDRFSNHIILPLHGWELVPIFGAFERRLGRLMAGGFTLGYVVHLIVDQFTNNIQHPATYSIVFRARRGFSSGLFGGQEDSSPHQWRDEKSLAGLLRWF